MRLDRFQRVRVSAVAVLLFVGPCGFDQGEPRRGAVDFERDTTGGRTTLAFEAAPEGDQKATADVIRQAVQVAQSRLNPGRRDDITVRSLDDHRIEVTIPTTDPELVARTKDVVCRPGTLEFAILANERDHASIIEKARKTQGREVMMDGQVVARWVRVGVAEEGKPKTIGVGGDVLSRVATEDGKPVVSPSGEELAEFLVIVPPEGSWWPEPITGAFLSEATPTTDANGSPTVAFELTERGGYLFRVLTTHYQPARDGFERRLGVVLDGRLHSAPGIQEPIGQRGQITGKFTRQEVRELVAVLTTGALPVPLRPVSKKMEPTQEVEKAE